MSLARLVYRGGQLRKYLGSRPAPAELEDVRRILTPPQMELFLHMQPGEQSHSLDVLHRLSEHGETPPNFQVAALLHDVGKIRSPLRIWERAWIVLARKIAPGRFREWGAAPGGEDSPPRWQRPFIVAEQHPAWGAALALAAGCSPLAVSLIRRHQEKKPLDPQVYEDSLLAELQAVDDQS